MFENGKTLEAVREDTYPCKKNGWPTKKNGSTGRHFVDWKN